MTLEEAVTKLDNCQYRDEVTKELIRELRDSGIAIVYGASDDIMVLDGAWRDETYGTISVNSKGIIQSDCTDDCPYFLKSIENAKTIEPLWCKDSDGFCWSYETNIPHLVFRVMEDEDPYCKGIAFYTKDADA